MRPDEDYEDLEQNTYVGNSRAMSWLVLAVAVGGFATLAYYAYHSASNATQGEGSVMIEADSAPIKQAPEDPEGEQFANKDKTIYDVIAPDASKQAEKLMPEPERPIAAANMEDEDSIAASQEPAVGTPVAAAIASAVKPEVKAEAKPEVKVAEVKPAPQPTKPESAPAPAKAEPTKTPEMKVEEKSAPMQQTTTYVAEDQTANAVEDTAIEPAPAQPVSYASPRMVNEKPTKNAEEKTPEPKKLEAKEVKKEAKAEKPKADKPAEEKPANAAAASGGAYKIQLGAYASEAEAQGAWKKLTAKFAGVLGGAPTIVKAEVNGKTYYRLRAGSYGSSADAKAGCAKLAGQACMSVK